MEERRQRKCKCGHTRASEHVVEEPEYSLWGWILLSMFGVTPKPSHVVYRCQMCHQSLGTTRDPKVLARRSQAAPPAAKAEAPEPPKAPVTVETAPADDKKESART